jgi:hypothetical protein
MAGLVPAIYVFGVYMLEDVDARHIGERSDAVLGTAMAGRDYSGLSARTSHFFNGAAGLSAPLGAAGAAG